MAHYNTILSQITSFIPRHDFEYHANIHHQGQKFRSYNRWSQFMAMLMDFIPEAIALGAVFANDHRTGLLLALELQEALLGLVGDITQRAQGK